MTSGNVSDEPQVVDDTDARDRLKSIAAYALIHDRVIANRMDDSLTRIMGAKSRVLRRARGFAPEPLRLPEGFEMSPKILALGGELKATFCLVKDGHAILSQHQGDLEHSAAFDDYRKNLRLYGDLFEHAPAAMPGGANAVREPWRNLYAHLTADRAWTGFEAEFGTLDLFRYLSSKPLAVLDSMIRNGLNAPKASSCGRLFDAVAAALDLGRDRQAYEGEAAMRLEAIVAGNRILCIRFSPMIVDRP